MARVESMRDFVFQAFGKGLERTSGSLRWSAVEVGGSVRTWDNGEFGQLVPSHFGFCLNFSFLLHSAALKHKVPKKRGRPIGGRWELRWGFVALLQQLRGWQTRRQALCVLWAEAGTDRGSCCCPVHEMGLSGTWASARLIEKTALSPLFSWRGFVHWKKERDHSRPSACPSSPHSAPISVSAAHRATPNVLAGHPQASFPHVPVPSWPLAFAFLLPGCMLLKGGHRRW